MWTILLIVGVNKIDKSVYNLFDRTFYKQETMSVMKVINEGISFTAESENTFVTLTSYSIYENKDLYQTSILYGLFLANDMTVGIIKYLTDRKRPDGTGYRFSSAFPSAHTANAFFIATLFSTKDERLAIPMYIWAFSSAFSRIYLKKHWFTDVIGGLLIGTGFGYLASKI